MEIAVLQAETRQPGGRHANERLRRRGMLPAVIYGHNEPPVTVAVSRHDLELALQHSAHVVRLRIDGREEQYLLKDVQFDHLYHKPIHVDLMRVDPNERVEVHVAIDLKGEPHGIHEGGVLVQMMTEVLVECPLLKIPEKLPIRIDHLGVGDILHVRDLELPEGMKAVDEPEAIICMVQAKKTAAVVEEAPAEGDQAAAAEPEVIGRGEQQEGEGEEGS